MGGLSFSDELVFELLDVGRQIDEVLKLSFASSVVVTGGLDADRELLPALLSVASDTGMSSASSGRSGVLKVALMVMNAEVF